MDSKFIPNLNNFNYFLRKNLTLSNVSISTLNNYGQLDRTVKRNCDISFSLNTTYILIIFKDYTATSDEGQTFPRHEAGYDKPCLKGKITASFAGPELDGIGTLYLVFDSPQKSKLFGHDYTQTCIWFNNKKDYESVLEHFQKYWTHDIIIHPNLEENPKTESNPNLSPNIIQESKIPESDIVCKRLNQKKPQSGAGDMRMTKVNMDSKSVLDSSDLKISSKSSLTISNLSISTQNNYGQPDPMVKRNCDITFILNTQEPYIVIFYKDSSSVGNRFYLLLMS